jgi:hypothetical protein
MKTAPLRWRVLYIALAYVSYLTAKGAFALEAKAVQR